MFFLGPDGYIEPITVHGVMEGVREYLQGGAHEERYTDPYTGALSLDAMSEYERNGYFPAGVSVLTARLSGYGTELEVNPRRATFMLHMARAAMQDELVELGAKPSVYYLGGNGFVVTSDCLSKVDEEVWDGVNERYRYEVGAINHGRLFAGSAQLTPNSNVLNSWQLPYSRTINATGAAAQQLMADAANSERSQAFIQVTAEPNNLD